MESLLGVPAQSPYPTRVEALQRAGIAVWDVLAGCEREGSLDSSIVRESIVVKDLAGFLQRHTGITHIFLNGRSVEKLFRQHVLASQTLPTGITLSVLPSTSPANARLSFEKKLTAWSVLVD